MNEILIGLINLIDAAVTGSARFASFLARTEADHETSIELYARSIRNLCITTIVIMLITIGLGITETPGWIIATMALICSTIAFLMLLAAAPVALAIDTAVKGIKGVTHLLNGGLAESTKRWLTISSWVILIQSFICLAFSILKVSQNPTAVPKILLAAVVLIAVGILSKKGEGFIKLARTVATIVIILLVGSIIFPQTAEKISDSALPSIDSAMAKTVSGVSDKSVATTPSRPNHFLKKVVLRGEDELSDPIDVSGIPAFWDVWFYAPNPQNTFIDAADKDQLFSLDGESMGISRGPWSFYGPIGDTVSALFLPKGTEPPRTPPTK